MPAPELYKIPPMDHQLKALAKAKGKRAFMYSCEQGTGKTFITINELAQAWGEGKVNGVTVFAPNGVHVNWVEVELPKIMPSWVRWRAKAWNADAGKAEMEDFSTIFDGTDSTELRILTMNWEGLTFSRSLSYVKAFIRGVTKLAIVGDESQAIANPAAKRVKSLELFKMAAVMRRTMTGTPILNAPFDLFAQYRFLDPGILRTTSYFAFKAEYADMMPAHHPMVKKIAEQTKGGRIPQIVDRDVSGNPRYKNLERLAKLIEPYTYRVLKSECLDLPEKIYTQTFFEMASPQRAAYRKMEKEFRFLVGSSESAVSKLTALGKLSQIASGFLIDTAERNVLTLVAFEDNPKIKLLRERLEESIEELGNQVIVWAHYRAELAMIKRLCVKQEWSHTTYDGETSSADRTKAIADFQAGKTKVFIVQQKAGSTGITLTAAAHVIYYSNTFSWGDRSQSEDRAHRIGQDKNVLYEDLLGKGTRDLKIVAALRNKKDLAALINGDPRELLED